MKLLIVLALLLLCWTVVPFLLPGRLINCDDPEAHEAADVAIQHINENLFNGYKHALNNIENVRVQTLGSDEIFKLELDLLETTCPHVSPTPLKDCVVRPRIEQAVKGDCDVRLKKQNGHFTVISIQCKSELDSAENMLRICPNCSFLAPLNDIQVVHAVDVSLHKFNDGNSTAHYLLHEIGRGKIQSGMSNLVYVEFVIAASNCTKDEAHSGDVECVQETGASAHFGACSGSVVKIPGALDEDVAVKCTIYGPQPGQVAKPAAPKVSMTPAQTNIVQSRFHHNLYHSNVGPHSSESNSAENPLLAARVGHAAKRSLTGEPVPPNAPIFPLCPGRKIHF